MADKEWISLRKFARLRGVALSAVQKAIESGRVTAVRRNGSRIVAIELHQATEEWNRNTDPAQAARSGQTLGVPAVTIQASGSAQAGIEQLDLGAAAPRADKETDGKDPHGYYEARAERERHQAKLAELELLEQLGRLVSVDDMRQVTSRRYRAIRDKLLNIPDRVSAILAAEKDPNQVHAALTRELKRVLHELSDDASTEAARGAAERVEA